MECLHHNKTATSESTSVKIGDEETSITETVISFLKSNTFSSILRKAIEAATVSLRDEIRSLKQELNNVKSSNVDMIKMLTDYPKNNLLKVPSFDVDVFSDISSDGINDTNEWKKKVHYKTSRDKSVQNRSGQKTNKQQKIPKDNNNKSVLDPKVIPFIPSNPSLNVASSNMEKNEKNEEISSHNALNDAEGFQTVVSRKKKRNFIRGKASATNENDTLIKAVPRNGYIYVGNLHPNTSENDLKLFLKSKFSDKEISVDKLPKRPTAKSVSFKITVEKTIFKDFFKEELWPEGILVKKFYFLKNEKVNTSLIN
ncbi:hypothetical protein Zmor_015092 [Zophobas morio]|uniref:RRM domain-containing protein n=1 Tax=Zophobas morio TaxID=2755281 RepID=A0AA38MG90_9CUCU|nr:hypothetical protein Zmor_015092 [Zophobas morio]